MPISDYTKQNLVPYITGDDHPLYRQGRDLVNLFNDFGFRDIYRQGLPQNPQTGQNYSRRQYVESRLDSISDENLILLLTRILNELANPNGTIEVIQELIRPDGFTINNLDGNFTITGGIVNRNPPVINQAHFQDIENRILAVLDEALVSITLVIAWFTNERLRDKLLEKQAQGVTVNVAIYNDGINNRHGVDLTGINTIRLRRGLRGGLMHDKFCIVDNQIVITGSYNWTNNAEFRNDENVTIERDPAQATRYSVEFRRLTTA